MKLNALKKKLFPRRKTKSRKEGNTFCIDDGYSLEELKIFLKEKSPYVDYVKFVNGTSILTQNLAKKINLYRKNKIECFPGGTLFEKFFSKNLINEYFDFLIENKFKYIEISDGTIDIPIKKKIDLIKKSKKKFKVFCEIGSKDINQNLTSDWWIKQISEILQAGCDYVILEGRMTADVGIYNRDGSLKINLIEQLVKKFSKEKIFFEAPNSKAQIDLINFFGPNVNLGNVPLRDATSLEVKRCGLKSETFFLK